MVSDDSASGIELTHPGVVTLDDIDGLGEEKRPQRLIVPTEWLSHARQFGDCTGCLLGIAGTAEPILQRLRQKWRGSPIARESDGSTCSLDSSNGIASARRSHCCL
jgi:hypothetical protein